MNQVLKAIECRLVISVMLFVETDDLGVVGSRPGSAREDDRPASERSASGRRGSASRLGTGSEENTARDLTGDDDFVAEGRFRHINVRVLQRSKECWPMQVLRSTKARVVSILTRSPK